MMEQEFTLLPLSKTICRVLSVLMVVFAFYLYSFYNSIKSPVLILMPALLLVAAVLVWVNQVKSKVIVSGSGITRKTVLGTTQLAKTDIKGYKQLGKLFVITPFSNPKSTTKISPGDFVNGGELSKWIKENMINLDNTTSNLE